MASKASRTIGFSASLSVSKRSMLGKQKIRDLGMPLAMDVIGYLIRELDGSRATIIHSICMSICLDILL